MLSLAVGILPVCRKRKDGTSASGDDPPHPRAAYSTSAPTRLHPGCLPGQYPIRESPAAKSRRRRSTVHRDPAPPTPGADTICRRAGKPNARHGLLDRTARPCSRLCLCHEPGYISCLTSCLARDFGFLLRLLETRRTIDIRV